MTNYYLAFLVIFTHIMVSLGLYLSGFNPMRNLAASILVATTGNLSIAAIFLISPTAGWTMLICYAAYVAVLLLVMKICVSKGYISAHLYGVVANNIRNALINTMTFGFRGRNYMSV